MQTMNFNKLEASIIAESDSLDTNAVSKNRNKEIYIKMIYFPILVLSDTRTRRCSFCKEVLQSCYGDIFQILFRFYDTTRSWVI